MRTGSVGPANANLGLSHGEAIAVAAGAGRSLAAPLKLLLVPLPRRLGSGGGICACALPRCPRTNAPTRVAADTAEADAPLRASLVASSGAVSHLISSSRLGSGMAFKRPRLRDPPRRHDAMPSRLTAERETRAHVGWQHGTAPQLSTRVARSRRDAAYLLRVLRSRRTIRGLVFEQR